MLFHTLQPTKPYSSLATPTPLGSISSNRTHPIAPFPGPGHTSTGTSLPAEPDAPSPDSVFSPQDSYSSGSDYKSATSRSPSCSPPPVDADLKWTFSEGGRDRREDRKKPRGVIRSSSLSDLQGVNRFAGCSQPPAKVEAFHGSLAAHLSTILLGNDSTAIISAAW